MQQIFQNYNGKIGRSVFITGLACYIGILFVIGMGLCFLILPSGLAGFGLLIIGGALYFLFAVYFWLLYIHPLFVKRLRDINMSGWYSLSYIIVGIKLILSGYKIGFGQWDFFINNLLCILLLGLTFILIFKKSSK